MAKKAVKTERKTAGKTAIRKGKTSAAKKPRKRKTANRKRASRAAANISRIAAALTKAGVPESSIAVLVADMKKQRRCDQLSKERAKLQAQADKLAAKIARFDAQLSALDGKKPAVARTAKKATGRKRGRPRGSRSVVKPGAVLGVLGKNKGKALLRAEVASALGVDSSKVGPPLAALLADGKIKRTGQRRGTRYLV